MPTSLSPSPPPAGAPSSGPLLRGWHVLAMILAFFGVIIGVNATMATLALSTFGGVETDSSYRTGQVFRRTQEAARAQDDLGWRVDVSVRRDADGRALIAASAAGPDGAPLGGLIGVARLSRPTDHKLDRLATLRPVAPGRYEGIADSVAPGQWDLVLSLDGGSARRFQSRNRLTLAP